MHLRHAVFPTVKSVSKKGFFIQSWTDVTSDWTGIRFLQSLTSSVLLKISKLSKMWKAAVKKKALCLNFAVCPALWKEALFSYMFEWRQGPRAYLDTPHTCRCCNEAETDGKVKEILMNVKGNCWNSTGEGQQTAGERRWETRRNKQTEATEHQTLKAAKEDCRA